ncbi:hypothetical protein ADUPG1_011976, partial [Aduncisulcus paluster]
MDPKPSSESEIQIIKPELIHKGGPSIPRDSPNVTSPDFESIKSKNETVKITSRIFDMSLWAKKMMEGRNNNRSFTHISMTFPPTTQIKGERISKMYEFPELDHCCWYFLPIDLFDVSLCKITGRGRDGERYPDNLFSIKSLFFIREETYEELPIRKARKFNLEKLWLESPNIESLFVHEGGKNSLPIPRDDPSVIDPSYSCVKGNDKTLCIGSTDYDQSSQARSMLMGERTFGVVLSDLYIPFSSPSSIFGVYICLRNDYLLPSHLIFTFTSSSGNKTSKIYSNFILKSVSKDSWFYLPVGLSDISLCEIMGKGEERSNFRIISLVFVNGSISKPESKRISTELAEKWLQASEVKPKLIKFDEDSIFIRYDDPSIINPADFIVKGKKSSLSTLSKRYDQSLKLQKMLKGENYAELSHLSVSFPSAHSIKGAYICIYKYDSSPSLLFTFTLSNGKKISKKYEFSKPKYYFEIIHIYELYFLPVDLSNVVCCDIQGKGTWKEQNCRDFRIDSLIFIKGEDISPLPSDSTKLIKHDSFTLTSSATITSQCIIGHGGFGEVLLVKVDADEKVVKECRNEFKMQRKLFNNPKCFNRIPRPLYILDLLDADMKGVYGYIMEYCAGGSVWDFARSWCDDGKYVSDIGDADDSDEHDTTHIDHMTLNPVKLCSLCVGMIECLDDVFRAKKSLVHRDVKPNNFLVRVDPKDGDCTVVLGDLGMVQITSIYDSERDLSMVESLDYDISSSTSSTSAIQGERKEKIKIYDFGCENLVYASYETFMGSIQTQTSDGYSLGMSILALFLCEHPFVSLPIFREVYRKVVRKHLGDDLSITLETMRVLMGLMEKNMCPKLSQSPLFRSLLIIEGGKFRSVHECLNEVFTGLTNLDKDERMSVHKARVKVQIIKHLLPEIGEGFKCPSIDDIVKAQLAKYGGNPGCIVEEGEDVARIEKSDFGYDGKKEYRRRIEFDEPISVSLPSTLQNTEKENHDIPSHDQESQSSHQDVKQIHTSQDSISTKQSTVHDHRDMITFSYERDGSGQKIFSAEENDHISKHQCLYPSSDSFFPILKDEKELEWQKYQKELNLSGVVMNRLCKLGKGGFGEVFLVEVNGIPFPCVLKRMIRKNREYLVNIEMRCRMEFELQKKLFEDSVCFYRIPRPLYILGPLDDDWRKCDSGFIMEFCDGGSVKDFSKIWCSDGKYDHNDSDTCNRYSDIATSI